MRFFILTAASALLCGSTALIGQPTSSTPANQAGQRTQAPTSVPTIEQQATLETWSTDQRAQYPSWPADQQTYFWTLTPIQQQAWWRLTPEQRTQIHGMPPEQRAEMWTSIEAQLGGGAAQPDPAERSETSGSSTAAKKSEKISGAN